MADNQPQHADDVAGVKRLKAYLDLSQAMNRLGNKHGLLEIHALAREWVEYIDRQLEHMNRLHRRCEYHERPCRWDGP